ncbi:hypothetical protein BBP40_006225 [Aspergillus hancockii]|nr:hypothetical protein BBP40_006225 [Aspergillus hancockii]
MNSKTTVSILGAGVLWGAEQWLPSASMGSILIAISVTIFLPLIISALYRLYIHPLRKIPGPRLAAVTKLYAFYYNYIQEGGYSKQFKGLHEKYNSPVVRIGPNHVHVDRPSFYDEVFRPGTKYQKDPSFYNSFGGLDGMGDTDDFRTYRNHISSLYSAKSVDTLGPKLLREVQAVADRLQTDVGTNQVVNIQKMFRTLSADMVLQILFPQDINLFERDQYHPFMESFDIMLTKTWLSLSYPFALRLLALLPWPEYKRVGAAAESFAKYCQGWMNKAQLLQNSGAEKGRDSHIKRYLELDPADEKKMTAIPYPLEDIFNFIAGGTDTTAYTTSCVVYYLLKSPNVLSKLQAELDEAAPCIRHKFDHKQIQSLPYLTAVIKEALRISSPVPGCLPRIVPNGGAHVDSVYIPSGNADLFPEPRKFKPERWLCGKGKTLAKWNIAFSRGPRQCIGMNVAYIELYGSIAYLFSRFEFALSGNDGDELDWVDRFTAHNIEDIKVKITKERWA